MFILVLKNKQAAFILPFCLIAANVNIMIMNKFIIAAVDMHSNP